MSLNFNKLEKVRDCADGKLARCPACAEAGQDRKGEHLRIYPDGRFGCCVHAGDREHRKKIYALAGERSRRGISVRVAGKTGGSVQSEILGRLGRVFTTPTISDGTDGVNEIETAEKEARTPRTGVCESSQTLAEVPQTLFDDSRTARTPSSLLTRNANKTVETEKEIKEERELKEFREGVRSVREEKERLPHLLADGTLVIPFDSPERYHWWRGGQSVKATHAEVLERKENYAFGF